MARLLRHWLVIGLTALVAVPIVVVVLLFHLTLVPSLQAHIAEENRLMAASVAHQIRSGLLATAESVLRLGAEIGRTPAGDASLQTMLDTLPLMKDSVAALYLLDQDFRVRRVGLPPAGYSHREDYIKLDFSNRAFILAARRTGQVQWSDSYLSSRGQITAGLAMPLPGQVLVAEIELRELSEALADIGRRGRMLAFVVDKQGHIVAHPDARKALQQSSVRQNPLVQAAMRGEEASAAFSMDGTDFLGSAMRIDGLDWIVVTAQEQNVALGTVRILHTALGLGGAATLLVVLLLALLLARVLIRHLKDFGNHVHAVAEGNYSATIPATRIAELNDLAASMRAMALSLLEREQRLNLAAKVFESGAEGICITDANQQIISANHALCRMSGYAAEELVGGTPEIFRSGRHDRAFYQQMWLEIATHGSWNGEVWNRRKDGELYPVWLGITAVRGGDGQVTHYIGTAFDITERKSAEDQIRFLAQHDALTKLPNQTLLLDRIGQALAALRRKECRAGVLLLDLDRFKLINDTLGHDAGDKLLEEVAERLRQTLRETETVARLGGDEFVILVPEAGGVDSLSLIAGKVSAALSLPYRIGDAELHVTPSIGISVAPDDGDDPHTLLRNADAAMYHAKDQGRNNFQFYAQTMNVAFRERLDIENDLRRALERNEFLLFYQPQVNCQTGKVSGMEALIRWQHPRRGMVPPNEFIQVAEETGIIVDIGAWVLREACHQAKAWHALGHALRMSVNLSARQFQQSDLMRHIREALETSGIDPHLLELELTESMLMDDPMAAATQLREISTLGIRLAVDDFGTGYSSLAYLKRFPLQRLKIDRSFVRDISSDSNDAAIVSAIVAMAESLHMEVIAEGVEDLQQLRFLDRVGCCSIQGFYFSKPQPAESFVGFNFVYAVPAIE